MKQPQRKLLTLGQDAIAKFRLLIEEEWFSAGVESGSLPSKDQILVQRDRFVFWTQSVNLMAHGHDSLDYLIRDTPVIKDTVIDLIQGLNEYLDSCEYRTGVEAFIAFLTFDVS